MGTEVSTVVLAVLSKVTPQAAQAELCGVYFMFRYSPLWGSGAGGVDIVELSCNEHEQLELA